MKIRYDKSVDAVYISLVASRDSRYSGFTYSCDPSMVNGQINLKFDISDRLIGIEILQASKKLPPELLAIAEIVEYPS